MTRNKHRLTTFDIKGNFQNRVLLQTTFFHETINNIKLGNIDDLRLWFVCKLAKRKYISHRYYANPAILLFTWAIYLTPMTRIYLYYLAMYQIVQPLGMVYATHEFTHLTICLCAELCTNKLHDLCHFYDLTNTSTSSFHTIKLCCENLFKNK